MTDNPAEIRHEIVVDLPMDKAFAAFLRLDRIKPREHNLLAVPIEETVVEEKVGGSIFDRGVDGSICRWARVLEIEPPKLFRFSWDIGPDWRIAEDLMCTSEVEVRFEAEGERTRVILTHRHLDRHGVGWEGVRGGVDSDQGWPLYLRNYQAVVADAA